VQRGVTRSPGLGTTFTRPFNDQAFIFNELW
jgi:hypothetical protein